MVSTPPLPSLGALQALAALGQDGSLAVAATRLGFTRSALSHRIADLEIQLGVGLVRRAGRRIVPTEDGEALLAALGDAVGRIEAAVRPLQRRRAEVRVSTVATFAADWLIPRLAGFHAAHPDIEIAVATTTRQVDLHSEDIDLAIRHGRGRWDGLVATLLFGETLLPVAAPDFTAGLAAARPWESATLIHARSREHDWAIWWKQHRHAVPDGRRLTVENRSQALAAALAGNGVALVDAAYADPLIAAGRLRPGGRAAAARDRLLRGASPVATQRPRGAGAARLAGGGIRPMAATIGECRSKQNGGRCRPGSRNWSIDAACVATAALRYTGRPPARAVTTKAIATAPRLSAAAGYRR